MWESNRSHGVPSKYFFDDGNELRQLGAISSVCTLEVLIARSVSPCALFWSSGSSIMARMEVLRVETVYTDVSPCWSRIEYFHGCSENTQSGGATSIKRTERRFMFTSLRPVLHVIKWLISHSAKRDSLFCSYLLEASSREASELRYVITHIASLFVYYRRMWNYCGRSTS